MESVSMDTTYQILEVTCNALLENFELVTRLLYSGPCKQIAAASSCK